MTTAMISAEIPSVLPLSGPRRVLGGAVRIPASKSITNRALLLAALAQGRTYLRNILSAEDSLLMITALRTLGITIAEQPNRSLLVEGCGGQWPLRVDSRIEVGTAGTVARFLIPLLCAAPQQTELWGSTRMSERPMGELIAALRSQGAQLVELGQVAALPLRILGGTPLGGGCLTIASGVSSQFISGLLLAAPLGQHSLELKLTGTPVSASYIEMTRTMMQEFGVESAWRGPRCLHVPAGQHYQGREYGIEGDASSASYFFALAALSPTSLLVQGLEFSGLQGDLGLLELLAAMGCHVERLPAGIRVGGPQRLRAINADMTSMSDVALTLAVVALFAEGTTIIRGIAHLRWKECDRLAALVTELNKLGAVLQIEADRLEIPGGQTLRGGRVSTYNDHRMAMALSLLSIKVAGMEIENPRCVEKTYPNFFADFLALTREQ